MRTQWYYRGSLNFCNYSCSYCPFAKQKYSKSCLNKDKAQWERFVSFMEKRQQEKASNSFHGMDEQREELGAVLVVPYGEALLHDYYWEGLARLSKLPFLEYIGAQSNFSFSVEEKLSVFEACHGEKEKLRLWGTFHPEMVGMEEFLAVCNRLDAASVNYCIGAVGVPAQLYMLKELREQLLQKHYLFINRMDGLNRSYTEEELAAFTAIDPYFPLELMKHASGKGGCANSCFVTGNGDVYGCAVSRQRLGNLYAAPDEEKQTQQKPCSKKWCDCYLAYNNLHEKELLFFEPYPAFRIPDYRKALFFDIDGTLVFDGETVLSDDRVRQLSFLSKHTKLFVATSLPYEIAMRKLGKAASLFSGGVFANGGRVIETQKKLDIVYPIMDKLIEDAQSFAKKHQIKCYVYWKGDTCYKLTLQEHRAQGMFRKWEREQFASLRDELALPEGYVIILEEHCLQITAEHTGKLNGILYLLKQLGLSKEEVGFFGNGENDLAALSFFPFSVAVESCSEEGV